MGELMWRATYSDGTKVTEDACRWAELDRSRLVRFEVFLPPSLAPIVSIDVAPGRRLLHRRRRWPMTGESMLIVATENEDRSDPDIYLARPMNGHIATAHLSEWNDDIWAPVPFDFEVVR